MLTASLEHAGDLAEAVGDVRVRVAERGTADLQGLLQHRLGLVEAPSIYEQHREAAHRIGEVRVVDAVDTSVNLHRVAEHLLGLGLGVVAAGLQQHVGEIVEAVSDVRVVLAEVLSS